MITQVLLPGHHPKEVLNIEWNEYSIIKRLLIQETGNWITPFAEGFNTFLSNKWHFELVQFQRNEASTWNIYQRCLCNMWRLHDNMLSVSTTYKRSLVQTLWSPLSTSNVCTFDQWLFWFPILLVGKRSWVLILWSPFCRPKLRRISANIHTNI